MVYNFNISNNRQTKVSKTPKYCSPFHSRQEAGLSESLNCSLYSVPCTASKHLCTTSVRFFLVNALNVFLIDSMFTDFLPLSLVKWTKQTVVVLRLVSGYISAKGTIRPSIRHPAFRLLCHASVLPKENKTTVHVVKSPNPIKIYLLHQCKKMVYGFSDAPCSVIKPFHIESFLVYFK